MYVVDLICFEPIWGLKLGESTEFWEDAASNKWTIQIYPDTLHVNLEILLGNKNSVNCQPIMSILSEQ